MTTALKASTRVKLCVRLMTAAVCALALASCAEQADVGSGTRVDVETTSPGAGGSSSETTPTSGDTTSTSPDTDAGKQATAVTIRVTGGLRGADERRVYSEGAPPPPGHTRAEVSAVLEAASNPDLIAVTMTKVPPHSCCDLQTYDVTVQYDDGSQRTYTSEDGLEQPKVFEEFLGMF